MSQSGQIVVEGEPGAPYVFFFTFRGVLDSYSSFLWVPTGATRSNTATLMKKAQ